MNSPLMRGTLSDPTRINKLCFTSCCNSLFYAGALGLVLSIRKFYHPEQADIVMFFNDDMRGREKAFLELDCEIQWERALESWVLPIVYQRPEYASDKTHYYHPEWQPEPGLSYERPSESGFSRIRHKHPLNLKAYCTAWCLVVRGYSRVIHIDCDAFLLARIDEAWNGAAEKDWVLGWDDGEDAIAHFEKLFHGRRGDFHPRKYTFNAGVILYVNGPGMHRLMLDFMFYIESCYHYTYCDDDQGLLRALVMFHCQEGRINLHIAGATCWNPTFFRANHLELREGEWFNLEAGGKQFIWHGAGGKKIWTGGYESESVNQAWTWITDGKIPKNTFKDLPGCLSFEAIEHVVGLVAKHFGRKQRGLNILELGTRHGRTVVGFCELLLDSGFEPWAETLDIYAPSKDYPTDHAQEMETRRNISGSTVGDRIVARKIDPLHDFRRELSRQSYDFIYIDACHTFRNVLVDCIIAKSLLSAGGIIIGDDLNLESVQTAIALAFGGKAIDTGLCQWSFTEAPV